MPERRAYAAIVIAVVGVSFASIFIRWSESTALIKATYRMGLASLFVLPLALGPAWKEMRALSRRDVFTMLAIGVALAVHFATWISSLDFTSVASSVILVNSHPLIVALLSHYIVREYLAKGASLGVVLGFAGVLVIAYADAGEATGLVGDVLAFIGGLMTAVYLMTGRHVRKRVPLIPYVFLVYSSSAVVLLATTLVMEGSLSPGGDLGRELLLFLGLALVSTILGHTLYNWALRYLKAPIVSTSLLGEPVGATLLAIAFLQETPSLFVFGGGALALLGIYLTARGLGPADRPDRVTPQGP